MRRLLKYDIKLQWRQGFWLIYSIITFIYLVILFNIPAGNRLFASILFILSDTSVLGHMFVGALILLEKQQNVMQTLFVTPLSLSKYLISKTLSLTLLALTMSIILYVFPNGIDAYFLILLIIMAANSFIFTLIGTGISVRVSSLNQFVMFIVLASIIIAIPTVPFILFDQPWWLLFFPLNAAFDLLFIKFEMASIIRITFDIASLLAWIGIAYIFARSQFQKYLNR